MVIDTPLKSSRALAVESLLPLSSVVVVSLLEEESSEEELPHPASRLPAIAIVNNTAIVLFFIILFSFIRISQHLMGYTYMYVPWFLFVL